MTQLPQVRSVRLLTVGVLAVQYATNNVERPDGSAAHQLKFFVTLLYPRK